MKKWLHFIIPLALTVVFMFFYFAHRKEAQEKLAAHKVALERQAGIDAAEKAKAAEIARLDAERRAADRLATETKREQERKEKWDGEGKKISDSTAQYNSEANALAKEIASLEIELDALRQTRDKANAELLEQSKLVERALIAKRTAELEIQRMTEMVVRKAAESSMTRAPASVALTR